jgi:hypothetical protein
MSDNTSSKPSFLTRAMNNVEARKAAKSDDTNLENYNEIAGKRALRKFGLVIAGTVAATATTLIVLNRLATEKTASDETVED